MRNNPPVAVGFDGSSQSRDAVRWGAMAAALRVAPLLVLTTRLTSTTYGLPVGLPIEYFQDLEREGQRLLTEGTSLARSSVGDRALDISTELVSGSPIPALLDVAKNARMVVVGSRGHGEYTGGLVASTSSAIAVHASCPVVVVREPGGALEPYTQLPVVVGVDGTMNSEPAIALAFEEASLRNVRLLAIHSWSDISLRNLYLRGDGADHIARLNHEKLLLAESLAGFGEQYPDVGVDTEVVIDNPAQTLIERSRRAQLVVLGRRGRGGFSGLLLGSTCRAVLHAAHVPVMVVNSGR